jgi:hypothetical protein
MGARAAWRHDKSGVIIKSAVAVGVIALIGLAAARKRHSSGDRIRRSLSMSRSGA